MTTALLQGFSIPLVKSPKLALTAHVKMTLHAALFAVVAAALYMDATGIAKSPSSMTYVKYSIIGGIWTSSLGDVMCSISGIALPMAAEKAGAICDPSEVDFVSKKKKSDGKGTPTLGVVMVKMGAVFGLTGLLTIMYHAKWSKII